MQLLDYVTRYGVEHDVRANTLTDYRYATVGFIKSSGNGDLDALSAAAISEHLAGLKSWGYSPHTIRGRRAKLLVLWRAAYRAGLTDNRPDADRIRRVKVPPPNPICWRSDDVDRLVTFCEVAMRRRLRSVPVPAGDYLAALFLFLWSSGMRLGDALSMEFAWLGPTVTFRQSKTSEWHRASLSSRTLAAIERIRSPERAMVWPRPGKSRTALYRLIRRAIQGAGLSGSSKYIRRGGATDCYQQGKDPARYCGHVPGSRVALRWYVSREAQIEPVSPTEL